MGGVVSSIFGGGAPSMPSAPSYDNSAEVAAAAEAERKRAAAAAGRGSTIRTSGAGAEEAAGSILRMAGTKAKLGA